MFAATRQEPEGHTSPWPDGKGGTIVIGLGNPILGDDGVGWSVVHELQRSLPSTPTLELECMAVGGLGLMERMLGYRRAILVDAISTGRAPIGTVGVYSLADFEETGAGHTASSHDASLSTALRAASVMGAKIPERIEVVAVEAGLSFEFSEELSPQVAGAVAGARARVETLIQE